MIFHTSIPQDEDGVFIKYPLAKPFNHGAYECIDSLGNHVAANWDGEKFNVDNQTSILFFKSNYYTIKMTEGLNHIDIKI